MNRLAHAGKIGITVFLSAILVTSGVLNYLKTEQAQRMVLDRVNAVIPGAVDLKSLRFSVFRGTFEMNDLSLLGPSGEALIGCKRLSGTIEWKSLLHRVISIADVLLEAPRATIRRDRSGNISLVQAFSTAEIGSSKPSKNAPAPSIFRNITITSARISNGSLRFRDEIQDLRLNLTGIDAEASADLLKPAARLTMSARGGDIQRSQFRTTLDLLKVRSAYEKDRLDPITIDCRASFGEATVTGRVHQLSVTPQLDLSLELIADAAQLKSDMDLRSPLSGGIAVRATIQGPADNPRVISDAEVDGANIAGARIDHARADMRLEDRTLQINLFNLRSPSGTLRLSAGIDMKSAFPEGFLSQNRSLETLAYQVQFGLQRFDLSTLAVPSPGRLTGIADAEIELRGKGTDPQGLWAEAAVKLAAKGLSTRFNTPPVDILLHARTVADSGTARLDNLSARVGDIRLQADGQVEFASRTVTGRVTLDAPNLERNLAPLGISHVRGDLHANAEVKGPLNASRSENNRDALTASLSLNGKGLAIKHVRLGNLSAALRRIGRDIYLDRFGLQNRNSTISASGSAQLFEAGSFTLLENPLFATDINGDALFLEDFVDNLRGKLSVSALLRGSLKQPGGHMKVEGKRLDLAVQKVESLRLEADLDGETIRIAALELQPAPGESVAGSGWISLQKSFELTLATRGINLRHIDRLRETDFVQGILAFDLAGRGSLDNPRIQGDIAVKQIRVHDKPVDDMILRLDLQDRMARISAKLDFDIDGEYHLQKKDFTVSLRFDQTELSPYFALVDRKALGGSVTGKFQARGSTDALSRVRASADVSRLDIFFENRNLIEAKPFTALLENEEIRIPGLTVVLAEAGRLEIKGQAKRSGPIALQAAGEIPLAIFHLFLDTIPDVTGNILLDARVQGDPFQPQVSADVVLKNAGFTVPGIEQKLRDVTGRLRITPRAITLHDLQGYLDTGRIGLSGRVDLASFRPTHWDLSLNAEKLPIRLPDTLNLMLDSNLKFTGSPSKSALTGEVVFLEGDYYKDVNISLTQAVTQKQRESLPAPPTTVPDFLKNTALNIFLVARKPFLVDNNLASLEIKPDMRLAGKPENPVISGSAVVESGTIEFRKNIFTVNKGVIDFISPYKIEPHIDIESETRVRNRTVHLKLSGPPDELAVKLTSDPPETEEDIISLLLFRKTTGELIEADGGMAKSTDQLMADIIGETFAEEIKKTTGLDIFEIGSAGSGTGPDRTTLTMGKELSRRLTLKYALDAKNGEMVRRAITEYKLLEHILLDGFQDSQGVFGGGVKLRLEFR